MDDGLTGLEAAVVLIAFVVVAAVFSHTIIAAGVSISGGVATEMHQGLSVAGSGLMVAGTVYATDLMSNQRYAQEVRIPIRLLPNSDPIDLSTLTIHIIGTDHYGLIPANDLLFAQTPASGRYSIRHPHRADQNPILKPGEMVTIAIRPVRVVNLGAGDNPTIEIIAPGIHPLRVQLSFPADLQPIMAVG